MKRFVKYIILYISFVIILLSIFINNNFERITPEQLLFSLNNLGGTSSGAVSNGFIFCLGGAFLITFIIFIIITILRNKIKENSFIYKLPKYVLILSIIIILYSLGFFGYFYNNLNNSKIYEDYYVDPESVDIEFPEHKNNLIYIYVESLEMSDLDMIPNLKDIALKHINFSNNQDLGGATYNGGSSWTSAAIMAQTSGISVKVPLKYNWFNKKINEVPGAYSLGEVLKENGYSNYFVMGSTASFGGRDKYLKKHGDYKILDYEYARDNKYIDKDYFTWWGMEDSKVFEMAKKELDNISNDKPFNMTILTSNTHFMDGYVEDSCKYKKSNNHYIDSFRCDDYIISEFIKWLEDQDYYDDTTIIVVGDHLTMQKGIYKNKNRAIFNMFINSLIEPNKNKERIFTNMDMYPTTLASLGARIDGDRLGLGTNLFSNKKTLSEEIGISSLRKELDKNSKYYIDKILGG